MDPIPFYALNPVHTALDKEIQAAIFRVFHNNQFILGEELEAFEREYAAFSSSAYAIGVGNGFDALYVSLKILGVGPGDEVIVPAHTYIATWLAVSHAGAIVVPVEVRQDTMLLDIDCVEAAVTHKTKAILPVHLYGNVCEMEPLMELARRHHLVVVEDNAQAHGAMYKGRRTGSFGDCNATSFYPSKNLGALGDGGMITTDAVHCEKSARLLRNYGSSVRFVNEVKGINSRLDEMQAAVLRVKLRYLVAWNEERERLARIYSQRLSHLDEIRLPAVNQSVQSAWHLFVIRTDRRDELKKFLSSRDITCLIHYPAAPHLQQAYRDLGYRQGSFAIAETIAATVLSLPLWPGMKPEQVERVCDTIEMFFK